MRTAALILTILLIACQTQELPPEPAPPGNSRIGVSHLTGMVVTDVPSWAAPPSEGFTVSPEVFTSGEAGELYVNVEGEDLVYNTFYVLIDNEWRAFTFPQQTIEGTNWIEGGASQAVDHAGFAPGEHPVITYACSQVNGAWDCHGNKWMIRVALAEEGMADVAIVAFGLGGDVTRQHDAQGRMYYEVPYGGQLNVGAQLTNKGGVTAKSFSTGIAVYQADASSRGLASQDSINVVTPLDVLNPDEVVEQAWTVPQEVVEQPLPDDQIYRLVVAADFNSEVEQDLEAYENDYGMVYFKVLPRALPAEPSAPIIGTSNTTGNHSG